MQRFDAASCQPGSVTLAVHLVGNGPLAGLKCSLGGRKCCDAGLRPLWAGSPCMQRYDAASDQATALKAGDHRAQSFWV
jgi:hypothetical protein